MHSLLTQPVECLRDVGLVDEGGIGVGRAAPRLEGRRVPAVGPRRPVHVVEVLRLHVVGLEVGVAEGPRGRHGGRIDRLLEVPLAQPWQGRSVDLGVATDDVVDARGVGGPVDGVPRVVGLVALLDEHRHGGGVLGLLGQAMPSLEHEYVDPPLRQAVGQRRTTHTATDDDDVRGFLHAPIPSWKGLRCRLLERDGAG